MAEDAIEESASINVRRMEKGSHVFIVNNYSLWKGIGVNKAVESDHFTVGGHHWAIRFYPDGKDEDACKNGDISVFVSLKSDTTTAVRIAYDLYLLDQSGGGNDWGYTLFEVEDPAEHFPFHTKRGSMNGRLNFINQASLEPSVYLKDDCLKISCSIGVLFSHIQNLPIIKPSTELTIWKDFGRLLESKRGADVCFKVDCERFWAHKCILAARSPALRLCFSDAHQQEEIVIPNMQPRIFKAMLRFIYTGTIVEEEQEASGDSHAFIFNSFLGKMLAAADRFELKRLKKICESRMLERLSGESVAYLSHLADLYHATELKAACVRFAAENKAAVVESSESNGSGYLECPLLFLEMASYRENSEAQLSTNRGKELIFSSKRFSVVKRLIWPWDTLQKKKKKMKRLIWPWDSLPKKKMMKRLIWPWGTLQKKKKKKMKKQ